MEYLRELKVVVEIDTNKKLDTQSLILMEEETVKDFIQRVENKIREVENL